MRQAITINESDDVAVALNDLPAGTQVSVNGKSITLKNAITAKHKFALQDFAPKDEVHMYGVVVGTAKSAIQQGEAITTSNLGHKSESFSAVKQGVFTWKAPDVSKWKDLTFLN